MGVTDIPRLGAKVTARWGQAVAACIVATALSGVAAPAAAAQRHRHRHHHGTRHGTTHAPAPSGGGCANANTPATGASVDTMRAAVVCLINQQRASHGLPGLTVSSQLNDSAQAWTNVMVTTGSFTHGPGTAFAGRISAAGYNWQDAGENIATGYPTPSSVVGAWMASPDHCRNILDPTFRNVGTGETPAPVGGAASGPATWTQDFGLLAGQSPLSGNRGPQSGCPY